MKYFTYPLLRFKESTIKKKLIPLTSPRSSWMREIIERELNFKNDYDYISDKNVAIIAKDDDDNYVGWGLISIRDDKTALLQVYVNKKHRRFGIGTEILERMYRYSKRVGIIQLEVSPRNPYSSSRFFKSSGFDYPWIKSI